MTRFYLDFEFIEDGITIDPISIGIVAENDSSLYLINRECDFSKASDWVLENVLRPIGLDRAGFHKNPSDPWASANYKSSYAIARSKRQIAYEVMTFIKGHEWGIVAQNLDYELLKNLELAQMPQFWGYYADYDWVCFCQLYGAMIDLPKGFPMYCNDIKQLCDSLGNPELPKQEIGEHNALADARWNKSAHEYLMELAQKS